MQKWPFFSWIDDQAAWITRPFYDCEIQDDLEKLENHVGVNLTIGEKWGDRWEEEYEAFADANATVHNCMHKTVGDWIQAYNQSHFNAATDIHDMDYPNVFVNALANSILERNAQEKGKCPDGNPEAQFAIRWEDYVLYNSAGLDYFRPFLTGEVASKRTRYVIRAAKHLWEWR